MELRMLCLGLGWWGLGCRSEAPPAPVELERPMALVLPTFVLGDYEGMQELDGRWLLREECEGVALTMRIEQGGAISLRALNGQVQQMQATRVDLGGQGTITLPWSGPAGSGVLELREAAEEQVLVTGLPGRERLRFARVRGPEGPTRLVERLLPPASGCGEAIQFGALAQRSGRAFVRGGDPCVTAELRLDLGESALHQAGERWPVRAAGDRDALTWLSVEREAGRLMGVALQPTDDGGLRLWLPSEEGMHSEDLQERRGRCGQ